MGNLGKNEIRFKARMFLHLQYACQYRVVHANAIAMTVFEDATDPFVSRLPGQSKAAATRSSFKCTPVTENNSSMSSGCWLCPAADHWCNDRRFHPLVDGKHEPITNEVKEAILKRIETSDRSQSLKSAERKAAKRYWSQHGL